MRATKAIIDLNILKSNISKLQAYHAKAGKNPDICLPVKADAYGHGAVRVAKAAVEAGVTYLAVATVGEGAFLRERNLTVPILLLSQCLPDEMAAVYEYRLTPLVSDVETIALLAEMVEKAPDRIQAKGRLPVFLKIDTGMGRAGCRPEDALGLAKAILEQLRLIKYAGTITHLAVSDSAQDADIAYTHGQIAAFNKAVDSIRAACINPGIVTAANSGGSVSYPDAWFDMVRPGIVLYGYQDSGMLPNLGFEPVMQVVTHIVHTKMIHKGESISYGRTWVAEEDTVIGVLPIGYADGLPRILSGNFSVAIGGKLYPLVGRICMDQCMVNLGANPTVKRWDEVIVFGGAPPSLNAADIAARVGSIPYEVTCNINQRVPRRYNPLY